MKVNKLFADHMVLQQKKKIPVWGQAEAKATVTVCLGNESASTTADADGSWSLELPAMEAARDLTMTVVSGEEKLTFTDVCVGEVWLAGGQSNMEFRMGWEQHYDEEVKTALSRDIRCFNVAQICYPDQIKDYDYKYDNFWMTCDEKSLEQFSAVGYYFAKELAGNMDVPVGIINCSWGGTTACGWMDPEYLKGNAAEKWLESDQDNWGDLSEEEALALYKSQPQMMIDRSDVLNDPFAQMAVKVSLSREEQLKMFDPNFGKMEGKVREPFERRPGKLYELMLKPLCPYAIAGAIWYQGESDCLFPDIYDTVMGLLVKNWRHLWEEDFPFYFVQLAPFGEWLACTSEAYPMLRSRQEVAAKTIPNAAMASIGDVGMEYDIHPKDKKTVGSRLGKIALHKTYQKTDIACEAPVAKEIRKSADALEICFDFAEGLTQKGEGVNALCLYDESSHALTSLSASVEDEKLVIRGKDIASLARVELAQTGYYEINIYNGAGIPALPFVLSL